MKKSSIFITILSMAFLIIACNKEKEQPVGGYLDNSKYPLSPSDPKAKLNIDFANSKIINGQSHYYIRTSGGNVSGQNSVLVYDCQNKKESVKVLNGKSKPQFARVNNRTSSLKSIAESQVIYGHDDRIQVTNTLEWPQVTACKIFSRWPNNSVSISSGMMIGPRHVLTSGSEIYSRFVNGGMQWASSITVVPALNGEYMPFGSANSIRLIVPNNWALNEFWDHNWGMIILDRDLGNYSGWNGIAYYGSTDAYNGIMVRTYGYPYDQNYILHGGNMYTDYDWVKSQSDWGLSFGLDIDTKWAGQEGSAILFAGGPLNNSICAVASDFIYINGIATNCGPRINATVYNTLLDLMAQN